MNLIWNKGGIFIFRSSNVFLISIALTGLIFSFFVNGFDIDIPSNYIFGLSIFTILLSLADFSQVKGLKNWTMFLALPISFSVAFFITQRGYDEAAMSRLINSITVLSLSLVLATIFIGDLKEGRKKGE